MAGGYQTMKKSDNRLCNLQLMTKSENMSLHSKERYKEGKMKHQTIAVINTTTGERFSSVKDAADTYKVSASLISRACRRKGTRIKKCAWEYERSDDLLTK